MGWFGFAQGVDSINCCSDDACCAAALEDRAEVALLLAGWNAFSAVGRDAAALRMRDEDCVICDWSLAGG